MLITNTEFLKTIANKKVLVACDISTSIKPALVESFVPTMIALCNNCNIKFKPQLLTFDHELCLVDYSYYGKKTTRIGTGTTDIAQLMDWIECFVQPIEVVIYITDGSVPWPEINPVNSKTKQYVQFINSGSEFNLPTYIEKIL